MSIKLLDFSKSGGCGCKIEPGKLKSILKGYDTLDDPRLLVGFSNSDDAAVMLLDNNRCLISTTDFFLPVVNDAYDFGQIAAANALSDVYAMGGSPVMAISILGWPVEKIPLTEARRMLEGASDICRKAGITIAGGHSIDSSEPFFGLCVTGTADVTEIKRNNTCQPGDHLYITKPLGLGLLSHALKHEKLGEEGYKTLLEVATKLNSAGTALGADKQITAMTDITGFGLLGHLYEMLGDTTGAELHQDLVPVIPEARELALQMQYPNITTNNYNFIADKVSGLNGLEFLWLCDPQTSGGLLFTSREQVNIADAVWIGRITDGPKIQLV